MSGKTLHAGLVEGLRGWIRAGAQRGCVRKGAVSKTSYRTWLAAAFLAALVFLSVSAPVVATEGSESAVTLNQSVSLQDEPPVEATSSRVDASLAENNAAARPAAMARPESEGSRPIRRGRTGSAHSADPPDAFLGGYRGVIGATAVVLLCIGLLFALVRRWMPAARGPDPRILTVVARAPLSPKHAIALVRLPRRFVLVGFGPEGVSVLSEITDADEAADLASVTLSGRKRFDDVLSAEIRDFADASHEAAAEGAGQTTATPSAVRDLLRRVRGLQNQRDPAGTSA